MCHRPELTTSIQSRTESFANGHESIEILRVFIFDGFKIENEKLRLLKITAFAYHLENIQFSLTDLHNYQKKCRNVHRFRVSSFQGSEYGRTVLTRCTFPLFVSYRTHRHQKLVYLDQCCSPIQVRRIDVKFSLSRPRCLLSIPLDTFGAESLD
jgi:hypothetical protein